MKLLRVVLAGVLCMCPLLGFAQWQWLDKDGRKVFSDSPPPADIPVKNILKQPGARAAPVAPPENTPAADGTSAGAANPPKPAASLPKLSGKDKELEAKKKQAEAAEAEKKKAEAEKFAQARAENCARVKRAKATFDSGTRIARTNDKGEREFLDDAARSAEVKRIQGLVDSECAPLPPAGGKTQ